MAYTAEQMVGKSIAAKKDAERKLVKLTHALKEYREALAADGITVRNMPKEDRALLDEYDREISAVKGEIARLDSRVTEYRQMAIEDAEAAKATPAAQARSAAKTASFTIGDERKMDRTEERAANAWRYADGQIATVGKNERIADHPVVAAEIAHYTERDKHIVGMHGDIEQMLRAMSTTATSAVVPTVWSTGLIEKARNETVCFEAGATLVPMGSKVVQIGRLTTDPTPAFKTEGNAISASDLGYDYVQLTATSLTALVVASVEFMQDGVNASSAITVALAKAMALELDKAILFGQLGGTGTNDEGAAFALASPYPKGILKRKVDDDAAGIIGSFPTNGTAQTAATPWNELISTVYYPLRNNEQVTAIVSNVALKQQYEGMYDTTYQPLRMPASIASIPWLTTNAIPSFTRGTMTSRATDVFAGDFSQVLVGERMGMEIRSLTERYAENGQVAYVAYWRGDVALARPKAIAVYRGLQGAA